MPVCHKHSRGIKPRAGALLIVLSRTLSRYCTWHSFIFIVSGSGGGRWAFFLVSGWTSRQRGGRHSTKRTSRGTSALNILADSPQAFSLSVLASTLKQCRVRERERELYNVVLCYWNNTIRHSLFLLLHIPSSFSSNAWIFSIFFFFFFIKPSFFLNAPISRFFPLTFA